MVTCKTCLDLKKCTAEFNMDDLEINRGHYCMYYWDKDKNKCVPECADHVQELLEEKHLLQTELTKHRWIPIEEQLPKIGMSILWIYESDHIINVVNLLAGTNMNDFLDGTSLFGRVTHWKPIILPIKQTLKTKEELKS